MTEFEVIADADYVEKLLAEADRLLEPYERDNQPQSYGPDQISALLRVRAQAFSFTAGESRARHRRQACQPHGLTSEV